MDVVICDLEGEGFVILYAGGACHSSASGSRTWCLERRGLVSPGPLLGSGAFRIRQMADPGSQEDGGGFGLEGERYGILCTGATGYPSVGVP